jgi:hypothetical protein
LELLIITVIIIMGDTTFSMDTMEDVIFHTKKLAHATDEAGRAKIQNALRELQFSLETPYETMVRLSVDVSTHPPHTSSKPPSLLDESTQGNTT